MITGYILSNVGMPEWNVINVVNSIDRIRAPL